MDLVQTFDLYKRRLAFFIELLAWWTDSNWRFLRLSGEGSKRSDGAEVGFQLEDTSPYRLSRLHFSIQKLVHTEIGPYRKWQAEIAPFATSEALGAQANDDSLGENFPKGFTALRDGDNRVVAGGPPPPFVFLLKIA